MQLNILQVSSLADFTTKPSQDVYRIPVSLQTTVGLLKLALASPKTYLDLLPVANYDNLHKYGQAINNLLGSFPSDTLVTTMADVIPSDKLEQMFVFIEVADDK